MSTLNRRRLLMAAAAGGVMTAARPILAQNKPDKLIYLGDNQGGWKRTLTEEVGPAFEKETGIKVEFTLLPPDAWLARLKAEMGAGSSGVDIAQWSVGMGGWVSPHMLDHNEVLARITARDPGFDWNDFLAGSKLAASYDCPAFHTALRPASWCIKRRFSPRPGLRWHRGLSRNSTRQRWRSMRRPIATPSA